MFKALLGTKPCILLIRWSSYVLAGLFAYPCCCIRSFAFGSRWPKVHNQSAWISSTWLFFWDLKLSIYHSFWKFLLLVVTDQTTQSRSLWFASIFLFPTDQRGVWIEYFASIHRLSVPHIFCVFIFLSVNLDCQLCQFVTIFMFQDSIFGLNTKSYSSFLFSCNLCLNFLPGLMRGMNGFRFKTRIFFNTL